MDVVYRIQNNEDLVAAGCKSARATDVFYEILNNEHPVAAGINLLFKKNYVLKKKCVCDQKSQRTNRAWKRKGRRQLRA